MTLEADILFSLVANETDAVDFAKDVRTTKVEYFKKLTDGTGADQAQIAWSDSRTVTGGISGQEDSLTLTALADPRGTVAFSALKVLYIKNTDDTNQLDLISGVTVQNSFDYIGFSGDGDAETVIPAGGVLLLIVPNAAGAAVTGGNNTVYFTAPTGTTYDIVFIGEGTIT